MSRNGSHATAEGFELAAKKAKSKTVQRCSNAPCDYPSASSDPKAFGLSSRREENANSKDGGA